MAYTKKTTTKAVENTNTDVAEKKSEKKKFGLHRREQVRFRLTEEPWKVNMGLGVENTFIQKS